MSVVCWLSAVSGCGTLRLRHRHWSDWTLLHTVACVVPQQTTAVNYHVVLLWVQSRLSSTSTSTSTEEDCRNLPVTAGLANESGHFEKLSKNYFSLLSHHSHAMHNLNWNQPHRVHIIILLTRDLAKLLLQALPA